VSPPLPPLPELPLPALPKAAVTLYDTADEQRARSKAMSGRILFPYDGSELAERALPCAIHLARAASMKLIMVQAVEDPPALLLAEVAIHALAHRVRREGIPVVTRVRLGPAAAMLDEEMVTWEPSWIVLSTHGESGTGRWLYGRIAEHVLERAQAPVLLVHPFCAQTLAGDQPRVLVPLDGSPVAEQAVPVARRLARILAGTLVLLRVVEPPLPDAFRYDQCTPYVEFDPHVELARAHAYLRGVAGRLGLDEPVNAAGVDSPGHRNETGPAWARDAGPRGATELHAVIGTAGSAIAAAVRDQRATTVVLTARGAGRSRSVLGGAATAMLHLTRVPLVLVPVPVAAAAADETGEGAGAAAAQDAGDAAAVATPPEAWSEMAVPQPTATATVTHA
jgi:nucleotide-binding universal stress UspA family protein